MPDVAALAVVQCHGFGNSVPISGSATSSGYRSHDPFPTSIEHAPLAHSFLSRIESAFAWINLHPMQP